MSLPANIEALGLEGLDALEQVFLQEQAKLDLWAFFDFVVIPDPPPAGTGSVKFEKWPHILRLHEAVESVLPSGIVPLLKARKIGATSYFEGRFLHKAMFLPGAFLPIMSQGEKEAFKVIADCKFIWEHLPDALRQELITDNKEVLEFKGGGTIQAFPATTKAGRSFTGTEILFDEADFHEHFGTSYDALLPLIGDSGGKMFPISTPNPEKVDSEFRQIYKRAENRLYLGYYDRPNRTEAMYEAARTLASDEANFEKENSRTEEEALAPPRASAYFDPDVLMWMLENRAIEPLEVMGGLVSIWKPPVVGLKYIIGGDMAWGKLGSYSVAAVFDWETAEQVAELHGRPHPNDAAYEVVELHKKYNHAYMGIERAGEGQERDGDAVVVVDKVVALLKECSCRGRLFYSDHQRPAPEKAGWQTDARSRPVMMGEFREAVRNRQVTIYSRGGLNEMLSFIRTPSGRPEHSKGAYDDRPIAYAIMWQMRKHAKFRSFASRAPVRRDIARF